MIKKIEERSEYHISDYLAEFTNPAMEQAYQKYVRHGVNRQLKTALIVWAILLVLFAIPDYNALGFCTAFLYLAGYRIVITAAIIVLIFNIKPETDNFKITYPVTALLVVAFSGFMIFFVYRPDVPAIILSVVAIEVVCLLMFFPIRFIFAFSTSVYTILITLITSHVTGVMKGRLISFFILFMLPVAVGTITAIRFGILSRKQFALLDAQKLAAEALTKSEKSLADAQARAHLGSFEIDFKNNRIYWSEEMFRLYGIDPENGPLKIEQFHSFTGAESPAIAEDTGLSLERSSGQIKKEYQIIRRSDGAVRWMESYYESIFDSSGYTVITAGTAQDITERKIAEEQIKKLLNEKELLLKEVHHRVKNNINIIMSLLSIQAENNPAAAPALKDARVRMQSMGVLYDKLYRSENFNEISVQSYLPPLIDEIIAMFPRRTVISVEKDITEVTLPYKTLSAIGILTNEIITNIIKHAFSGRERGEIKISFSVENGHVIYIIRDNGIGIPESVDLSNTPGFGLQLVDMLCKQIRGRMNISRSNGTTFRLEFEV